MNKTHIRTHNQFKDALLINSDTFVDYLYRFKKIALSMFHWKNIPDSMDARFLELSLYYMGQAAVLKDENMGLINTKCASNGYFNIYGIPTKLNCWSYSYNVTKNTYVGYEDENINADNIAVLVMNNYDMMPTAATLELFAYRLTEAQRTCDMNIKQQKFPRIILTDKAQELTMKNLVAHIDNNELNIIGDKNLITPEQVRSIDTNAPYVADKITEYKKEIWNEFLTFMGISNMDYKKERMITSESDSKNELINMNLQSLLIPRQEAAEAINKVFGTNIEVVVRSDLHNTIKEVENSFIDKNGDGMIADEEEETDV